MILRLGIPKTSGTFPIVARKIGAAVMVSAGALWVPSTEQFRLPSGRCALLDMALDSSGFVRHAYHGGYPWSVAQMGVVVANGLALRAADRTEPSRGNQPDRPQRRAVRGVSGRSSQSSRRERSDIAGCSPKRPCASAARTASRGLRQERGADSGGKLPSFVGVGSLCTRHVNGPDGLLAVLAHLDAILPAETRLHLYGVKGDAIAEIAKYKRVASLDSMGWVFGARAAASKRFVKMTAEVQEQVQLRKLRNTTAHREQHMRAWYARQCQIIKENSDVRV